jgi:hypothetical protein
MDKLEERLRGILSRYSDSFSGKEYKIESDESDVLMEVFGITQELKKENKQYWGRELGMCWQLLVVEVFKTFCKDFAPAKKYGEDEPADFFVKKDAVDTKYRVGSGDSGTLKKFKQYGDLLKNDGYTPVFLFLRTDNLPAAMTACKSGGWTIYESEGSFKYILAKTNFDLKSWLVNHKIGGNYTIIR